MNIWFMTSLVILSLYGTFSLDNGLARTPPMGWMAWERFRCNIDCVNDPDNCIGEKLFMQIADHMSTDGFKDVGYEYVAIDDCWMSHQRDSNGKLYGNTTRFPSGIKRLADYVHSKGLKLGIYEDYGKLTCAGYPGSLDHLEVDAQTFADWGVDYLKFDGCYSNPKVMDTGYPQMTKALNKTGIPIVFSCSWPDYQRASGMKPNYTLIGDNCNLWRNFNDIQDSWDSVTSIIDYYAKEHDTLAAAQGPGKWNDPDMVIIGDFGLSYDQSKSQMAMWSIFASPLMMSNDLRSVSDEAKEILLNKEIIAVNQDALGVMGRQVYKTGAMEVWTKPLVNKSFATVFLNRNTNGMPRSISMTLKDMGYNTGVDHYTLRDVYLHKSLGNYGINDQFTATVNPTGVVMVTASISTT
ncbi:alpha-N-acetylgalactosaminidase-like [Saccoglossus kowalevskii]|uniref:Alpha-galactosidase n=1 Tax=Saccoglossus kowalevskii TaxID=10224 RepID=A0ABM0GNG4_SACKO|nr:PREDICTED: alpha-N-acetylgalactosaminidase-like [Saccoglossus kowalevskii]